MSEKPDPKAANPEDELVIEEAKSTIGDYKLKANLEVDENPDKRLTVERKYHELIRCRRKVITFWEIFFAESPPITFF